VSATPYSASPATPPHPSRRSSAVAWTDPRTVQGRDGEGILTAELDLDDLARARFDLDTTGHYARPDVFTLHVDESPRATVTGG
jgi:predicted amidohydrolase